MPFVTSMFVTCIRPLPGGYAGGAVCSEVCREGYVGIDQSNAGVGLDLVSPKVFAQFLYTRVVNYNPITLNGQLLENSVDGYPIMACML